MHETGMSPYFKNPGDHRFWNPFWVSAIYFWNG